MSRLAWAWSGLLSVAICAPLLLGRGFALTHDMVFVPHEAFKSAWLGLDGSVPRAVPSDAVVSLLSVVVPGDLLQKAVLVALLLLAGGGAACLVARTGLLGQLAASTLYVWNPYVYERLAMGQWALLCGYAALPWVVVAAGRVRRGKAGGWPLVVIALSVAGFTSPTGGVLAALLCCVALVGRDLAVSGRALAMSVIVNLPWLVPSLLYRGGIPSDPDGVSAFAARADTPYGIVGSLASLGGIWNSDVVPAGRDGWVLSGFLLMVCIGGLVGLWWADRLLPDLPVRRLALLGAFGLLLALLPAVPGGLDVMQWVDVHIPGAGLVRDSQKWVALLALAEVVGLAALVATLREQWRRFGAQAIWWLLAATVLLPLAATAPLSWGLSGRLEPVGYPSDWSAVATLVDGYDADGPHGDLAVLPWSIYREYAWNAYRPVLDPAPRFLPGSVVIADTLVVGNEPIGGEDRQAARIGAVLARGGDVTTGLRRFGVGLVVVEKDTPGVGQNVTITGRLAFNSDGLQLWELAPPDAGPVGPSLPDRALTIVGSGAAGCLFLGSVALLACWPLRRYTRR